MDSQILLNVNFCSEVHTNLIEKNDKSVYVRAGYSLGGLRIVPQENTGICVICADGHIKRVYPGELEAAVCIEESCSFISVEQDLGFGRETLDTQDMRLFEKLLTADHAFTGNGAEDPIESATEEITEHIEKCGSVWQRNGMADSDIVKQADVIYAAKGKISISELAEQMGCTVRHVHRRFVEELGVSPKRFARIVRIRETVRKMLEHPGGHVTDYMDDMGYSDQAHFQREFKWYTGMTPGSLLKILGDRAER